MTLKKEISELKAQFNSFMLKVYPIGCIYMSIQNISPNTLFGGTWVEWGKGRVPVGVNADDNNFKTVEKIGGESTHTLTVAEMPSHNHVINRTGGIHSGGYASLYGDTNNGDKGFVTENNGKSIAHNNLQPYITCYMWKRTA